MKTLRDFLFDLGIRTPRKATLCAYKSPCMSFYTEHSDMLFHHGDVTLKATQLEALHRIKLSHPSGYFALDIPAPTSTIHECANGCLSERKPPHRVQTSGAF